jgi:fibronectin-binding autotransporter adhesin
MWHNNHERGTHANARSLQWRSLIRIYTAVAMAAGSLSFVRTAHSSTLTWDASGANPINPTDGTGTWDTSPDADWSDGSADAVWNADATGATDTAIFGNNNGTAGTVTLAAPLTAGAINFLAPGSGSYVVGNSTNQLTISTGDISVAPGVSATITAPIAGSNGLTVSGGGTLHLGGLGTTSPVAYTGNTTVNNSTLVFNNLSTSTAITLGAGATSNVLLTGANAALTSSISQSKK